MSMELYNRELAEAQEKVRAAGKRPEDFDFAMTFQEPDPEGDGMFTVRYDIAITHKPGGEAMTCTGGIGLRWVDQFAAALEAGRFDA